MRMRIIIIEMGRNKLQTKTGHIPIEGNALFFCLLAEIQLFT